LRNGQTSPLSESGTRHSTSRLTCLTAFDSRKNPAVRNSQRRRNNSEQIGRARIKNGYAAFYFCRECAEERNQSVRKLNAGRLTCLNPKEPPTGTQACSPCCTPTWSRRMRHWSARARARRDPRYAPQTRDAKWARGSRSQTHRRAAKGGFTQTTVRWSEGLVPDRRPPPLFLRCSSSCDFFINVSQY
jgi:hypothetical protein